MPEELIVADPPIVTETPEYLNEPDYEELMADEGNAALLSRYKTKEDVAKALIEKHKHLSSGFKIPDKLNDDQVGELTTRLAAHNKVPENAEGYTLQRPEELNEKLDWSEEGKMSFRSYAKENNLSPKTVQGLYEMDLRGSEKTIADLNAKNVEAKETERQATVALMQKYWGPGEYEKRVPLIDTFIRSRAEDDADFKRLSARLDETGLKNDKLLMKLMGDAALMRQTLEGNGTVLPGQFSPSTANRKISAEQRRKQKNPNTPQSLGGGGPG